MQKFVYYAPTEIVFGPGTELRAAELVKKHGGSRVLVVYGGKSAKKSGLIDRVVNNLEENGIPALRALWPSEADAFSRQLSGTPSTLDLIARHEVELVINIPKNFATGELTNGYRLRRAAIDFNVPLITNSRLAKAYVTAFCSLGPDDLKIKAWDEY